MFPLYLGRRQVKERVLQPSFGQAAQYVGPPPGCVAEAVRTVLVAVHDASTMSGTGYSLGRVLIYGLRWDSVPAFPSRQRRQARRILCDTGPLVAASNKADNDHARCMRFLRETGSGWPKASG